MKEEWKDIEGYQGNYRVSNHGRILSMARKYRPETKQMKPDIVSGYEKIVLCFLGDQERYAVHRLVALHFIPNPENKPQVNHIDGDKRNNHVDNLEWVTASENSKHFHENLRTYNMHGEDGNGAKLTEEQVREIRSSSKGNRELAKIYNITHSNVSAIRLRKSWKHLD